MSENTKDFKIIVPIYGEKMYFKKYIYDSYVDYIANTNPIEMARATIEKMAMSKNMPPIDEIGFCVIDDKYLNWLSENRKKDNFKSLNAYAFDNYCSTQQVEDWKKFNDEIYIECYCLNFLINNLEKEEFSGKISPEFREEIENVLIDTYGLSKDDFCIGNQFVETSSFYLNYKDHHKHAQHHFLFDIKDSFKYMDEYTFKENTSYYATLPIYIKYNVKAFMSIEDLLKKPAFNITKDVTEVMDTLSKKCSEYFDRPFLICLNNLMDVKYVPEFIDELKKMCGLK